MTSSMLRRAVVFTAGLLLIGTAAHAQSGTLTISGNSNVWNAGRGSLLLPYLEGAVTSIGINAGTGRILKFSSITGDNGCCTTSTGYPPDGAGGYQYENAIDGISGIQTGTTLPLLGVFLGATGQPISAPAGLDFSGVGGQDFASIAPLLGQTFFIGNGFTSALLQQLFYVPDGATTLYFGIEDACGFSGYPNGCYNDNLGSYEASYDIEGRDVDATPEPASLVLLGTGLAGVAGFARRKKIKR